MHVRTAPDAEPRLHRRRRRARRTGTDDVVGGADVVVPQPRHELPVHPRGRPDGIRVAQRHRCAPAGRARTPRTSGSTAYGAPPAWARRCRGLPDLPGPLRPLRGAGLQGRPRVGRPRRLGRATAAASRVSSRSSCYGGDLDGITEHLDHIAALGANVVYLTPFFPARSNHRYDASSFDQVDPVLGGDEALARLVDACARARHAGHGRLHHEPHRRRARVVRRRPGRTPTREERGYYFWEGERLRRVARGARRCPSSTTTARRCATASSRTATGWCASWITGDSPPRRLAGRRGQHDRAATADQDLNHDVARQMRAGDGRGPRPTPCSWASTATTTPRTRRATAGTA